MSLQLQPDQLLAVLYNLEHPRREEFEQRLLELCTLMGAEIVHTIPNLTMGRANFWDNMVCLPISPLTEGPIPDPLRGFDDAGWN